MSFIRSLTLGAALISNSASANPLTIWNQAYQENYEADALDVILSDATNGYVLLDPFDEEIEGGWRPYVAALQANGNEVGAYISIGTAEDWRSDFDQLKPALVETQWTEWSGEYFIDRADENVMNVMQSRIDRIAALGFNWVEFDNMDWAFDIGNRTEYGFHITEDESQAYAQALCDYAHSKGVKCMAKSMIEGLPSFDGATYESYSDNLNWWDQDAARNLVQNGKLMIIIHYDSTQCPEILAHYEAFYGPEVSFLCETKADNGYIRLPR